MTAARAFWLHDAGRGVILEETLVDLAPGWCRVRARFSAVSPGTERLVAGGRVPPALYEEMRCPYMGGRFPFPVKYGYSLVGRVEEGPPELSGRLVHVLHPHQDVCAVRAADAVPVPERVPPERATLASNLETAVTAVWDSGVGVGDRALVVGFGTVGALIARLLRGIPGVELEVEEARRDRRDLAVEMGFRLAPERPSAPYDLAFDAGGTAPGLQTALDRVGREGRVVEVSWFGVRTVPLALGGTFHAHRKSITASQVSSIPPARASRWDARRRRALVLRLLEDAAFDAHVPRRYPFDDLPEVFRALRRRGLEGLGALVEY